MTAMVSPGNSRSTMWEVTSRVVVYSAIGAVLYGLLLVIQLPLPGTQNVSLRPAFGLVSFFGYAFGPIVGFFTGLVGNAIGDQLSGWGALTSWNWSLANGFVGLIAGLAPLYLARLMDGTIAQKALGGAIAGIVATLVGFLFIWTDMLIGGMDFNSVLITEYIPVVVGNVIVSAIVVPILVFIWAPIQERMGR
ncbi:MAG: ECF transporter S component [Candidatus Limnocylindrales bacterium]